MDIWNRIRKKEKEMLRTDRQIRTLTALLENPEGLLSYRLRQKARCISISQIVQQLRNFGFNISCTMVKDKVNIFCVGKYKLEEKQSQEVEEYFNLLSNTGAPD